MILNQVIGATETAILTATSTSAVVSMLFFNADTSTRTLTVYAYPDGESAGDGTTIFVIDIPAKDTFIWTGDEKLLLQEDAVVSAVADVASKVTCTINYLEI